MKDDRSTGAEALRGYTTILQLEFVFNAILSACDLILQLENSTSGQTRTLHLKEVAGLRLSEFGGGLTQLLLIVIEDIHEMQLDRINFRVREVERGIFECQCRSFEIR